MIKNILYRLSILFLNLSGRNSFTAGDGIYISRAKGLYAVESYRSYDRPRSEAEKTLKHIQALYMIAGDRKRYETDAFIRSVYRRIAMILNEYWNRSKS